MLHLKETAIPKSYLAPRDYTQYYVSGGTIGGLAIFSSGVVSF